MIPLKILLAAPLLMPVADRVTEKKCAAGKPFKSNITVKFEIGKTHYDYSKSVKQISAMSTRERKAWNARNALGQGMQLGHTSGLTVGKVKYKYEVNSASGSADAFGGAACPYVKDLLVTIQYGSTIYIGREYKNGSCYFMEVLEHEHKHHNVNLETVGDYVVTLRKDLPELISYIEKKNISHRGARRAINDMHKGINEMLEFYGKDMNERMRGENEEIDTPEEYARVSRACKKGFFR